MTRTDSARVLLVGVDAGSRSALDEASRVAFRECKDASTALALLDEQPFEVLLADCAALDSQTLEFVRTTIEKWPETSVILLSTEANVQRVVEAMQAGASDYLELPCDPKQLQHSVQKAVAASVRRSAQPTVEPSAGDVLLGDSRAMQTVRETLARAAGADATVLIRGESGTGKELAARTIHRQSERASGPLVVVQCAALPDQLLESELFGYERGAFTGATQRKLGRVEVARGGTLFLDEIGDIPAPMQVKLLRLLQEREFERLGSTETLRADVRFVTATHRDLEAMVKTGDFREDLFYRINVLTLWLPPLRARRDDIALLAREFTTDFARRAGKPTLEITEDALRLLRSQRWPGNVRQLQNFIERLVVLGEGTAIRVKDVQRELSDSARFVTQATGFTVLTSTGAADDAVAPLSDEVRAAEKKALIAALEHPRGNRQLAARLLCISRATLYNKLADYDLG
ncbi:MAG TPA: sigma-54 dependent transcriptional regulator [Polyangiaceae bacterium]|nr:sigma-54 dependent transcriptional regulator [Polyangiaceae bacterium]